MAGDMKAILLLVTLLAAMPLPGAQVENLPRLTVGTGIGSEVFSNVTVTSVTATHIYFSHSSGLGSAKLKDLEPEMQERFRFNPANARIAEARQAQANALYLRELAQRTAAPRPVSPASGSDDDTRPTTAPVCEVSPNPPPLAMHTGLSLTNFADHPLFARDGPSPDDVFQGGDGDCYFLSRLAALAGANPDFIRRTVTDLKDGTYVVRFFQKNGAPTYIRVTSELWVTESGALRYARLGRRGCLWVPIIEKAFAVCRRSPAGYDSIYGGNAKELNRLVWNNVYIQIDEAGVKPAEVIRWSDAGAPDGAMKDTVYARTIKFLNEVNALRQTGKAMVMGAPGGFSDATPLVPSSAGTDKSTYRRGQHVYMVDHVEVDASGNCTGIVLRDPHGAYRKITDFARLFFCTGSAVVVEPQG
jgi:hypothetical protein